MAIIGFRKKEIEAFFVIGRCPKGAGWVSLMKIVKRKLDMLHYASDLLDLRSPPNNCLELLKGDLKGFYSIRVNAQWRVIFRWEKGPLDVDVVDYH